MYAAPEAGPALLDLIDKDPYSGVAALQMVTSTLDPLTIRSSVRSHWWPWSSATFSSYGSASATAEPDISPRLKKEEGADPTRRLSTSTS